VYTITHRDSGKSYVGLTSQGVAHRWGQHRSDARRGKNHSVIAKAIRKYGPDAFDWLLVAEYASAELAGEAERDLILATSPAYNLRPGGVGGYAQPASVRAKMSAAALKRPPMSAEAREKISLSKRGLKASPEARARMSAAQTGRKASPETRAKLSAAQMGNTNMLGKKRTAETRAKMSAALIGNTRWKANPYWPGSPCFGEHD
jgi:group I intron endonuclease